MNVLIGDIGNTITKICLDAIKNFKVKKIIALNPKDLDGIKLTYNSNNEVVASYERNKHKIDEIISKIKSVGMEIYDISTDEGDLEDVFINVTKS